MDDTAVRDAEWLIKRTLQIRHAERAEYDPVIFAAALLLELDTGFLYASVSGSWAFLAGCLNAASIADVPTDLTVADAGVSVRLLDTCHHVLWDGAAWTFAPGDSGNGFLQSMPLVNNGSTITSAWALADGSVATYLVVGEARLRYASVRLPNCPGSRFRR